MSGSKMLLNDLQILTHPMSLSNQTSFPPIKLCPFSSIGRGMDIFGEGNVEIGMELLKHEHVKTASMQWLLGVPLVSTTLSAIQVGASFSWPKWKQTDTVCDALVYMVVKGNEAQLPLVVIQVPTGRVLFMWNLWLLQGQVLT
ncbi:hypothetical protein EDC04DRAFT_2609065 [Pisolithus marmoratus]|nr:hypothetical protein EDC04DRAFT_2609065 [Pisolithus marmoratus]